MKDSKLNQPNPMDYAKVLFQVGKFEEVEKVANDVIQSDAENYQALLLLGKILLFKNKIEESKTKLLKAKEVKPDEKELDVLLSELYFRIDDYQNASKHQEALDRKDNAKRLLSFKDTIPFEVRNEKHNYRIKLLRVDPLPVIEVKINNQSSVNFLIDTGAAETVIDLDYAKELGLEIFGSDVGTFAGGKQAVTYSGKVQSFTISDLTIHNMLVHLLPVRPVSQMFGGMQIDGIIGTVLFYHFITTLDYPNEEVIFRKKTDENMKKYESNIEKLNPIIVPFWMVGDHFMVAWGSVNNSDPILMFLDTGLAGGGFIGSKTTLDKASIELDESKAFIGLGGGGKVKAIPFVVDELSFGDAQEKNIGGVYTANFPLENMLGFQIGGIISHQFFKPYALTFDFKNMRFILVRNNTKATP